MDPRQVPVAARELAELRFLAVPENSQRNETHQVRNYLRAHRAQRLQQSVFAVNRIPQRSAQIDHQQRHRKRKNAVAQRGQALDILPRQPVVSGCHLPIMRCRVRSTQ